MALPRPADILGATRFACALALPWALARVGGWWPLALTVVAAVSDYVDGPLARRSPATRHGALLDNLADVTFVLAGTVTGAAMGLLHWAAPLAILVSFGTYLRASGNASAAGWRPARSRLGHAAGVLNYGAVFVVAAAVAVPAGWWSAALALAGVVVAAVNVGAVLMRIRAGMASPESPRQ